MDALLNVKREHFYVVYSASYWRALGRCLLASWSTYIITHLYSVIFRILTTLAKHLITSHPFKEKAPSGLLGAATGPRHCGAGDLHQQTRQVRRFEGKLQGQQLEQAAAHGPKITGGGVPAVGPRPVITGEALMVAL